MSTSVREPQIVDALDQLIREVGGDPEAYEGSLVRQLMQAALCLIRDSADAGEYKLVSRSFRELRYAMKVFRPFKQIRKISIFGSARTPTGHSDYRFAARFGQAMAASDWMVITGAGDGIMRAGHEGAGVDKSIGVAIRLPFETSANDIIANDPKLVTFRYFFTRKLMFVWHAHALALAPGGFGTLDECFEVLTLVQTGKAPMIPIVMLAPRDNDYWYHFDHYIRTHLLTRGLIDPDDLNLYHLFDDPDAAAQHVLHFYHNFHSERMVGDRLVLRINHPLSDNQLDHLNGEFGDLVADGRIEQTTPLPEETVHLDLPRLTYISTRRTFGRQRLLIDRINQFALQ